jgi:TrkA domain protein
VEQTPIPGVGVRYDFATEAGRRLGLVVHRDGWVDLVTYAEDDRTRSASR